MVEQDTQKRPIYFGLFLCYKNQHCTLTDTHANKNGALMNEITAKVIHSYFRGEPLSKKWWSNLSDF